MNKAELIDVLTKKLDTDRRTATDAVENVVDTIVRAVHKGDSVTITGFGVFEQRRRAVHLLADDRRVAGAKQRILHLLDDAGEARLDDLKSDGIDGHGLGNRH